MADVEAHITGTVWKIEVAVGDAVEEGDTVVILESMKMEMPVEAEEAGTVKEILSRRARRSREGDRSLSSSNGAHSQLADGKLRSTGRPTASRA